MKKVLIIFIPFVFLFIGCKKSEYSYKKLVIKYIHAIEDSGEVKFENDYSSVDKDINDINVKIENFNPSSGSFNMIDGIVIEAFLCENNKEIKYNKNEGIEIVDNYNCNMSLENLTTKKISRECPNCVYSYYTDIKKFGVSGSVLDNFTDDYRTLNSNVFIGHILNDKGQIIRAFVCGKTQIGISIPFCLEGTYDEKKKTSLYNSNKSILENISYKFIDGCREYDTMFKCSGLKDNIVNILKNGDVDIQDDSKDCMVRRNNIVFCLK